MTTRLFSVMIIVLVVAKKLSSEPISEQDSSDVKVIFDLLQSGDKNIKLNGNEDIILLLGNTGAGKSTFSNFIAGDNDGLFSLEVNEDSGEYIIIDQNNKISQNSTTVSKTLYPELIVDPETKVAFYDCPGFSDTRSAAHDISATYFVKRVIDSAKRVKLVIVVNYSSVRIGVDRLDFKLLLRHATDIIKDVEKFRNSIVLIVTKVDNNYIRKGKNLVLVPDEKVLETIANFLKEVKNDIKTQSLVSNPESNYTVALSLIDIFWKTFTKNRLIQKT